MNNFREEFPQKERHILRDLVKQMDRRNHTADVVADIITISRLFKVWNLATIEEELRNIHSRKNLLALPDEQTESLVPANPFTMQQLPYYLFVNFRGNEEAARILIKKGSDLKENFRRLPQTGLLMLREGSAFSRRAHSRLN